MKMIMEVVGHEEAPFSMESDISTARKQSLRARYVYGCIFLMSNLLAWVIRDYGHSALLNVHYLRSCKTEDGCYRAEGILRVSSGCFIFFLFMFVTTCKSSKLYAVCSSWHSSWWSLKFVLWIISMLLSAFIPVSLIQIYGEIARFGAGIFLVLQLVSVIQFLTVCGDYFLAESKSKLRWFVGAFLSTIFYVICLCGITSMYFLHARGPTSALNIFFITWTAILVIVMMVVSLHFEVDDAGLLSSGIMGSYAIFLCWSAIRSEPPVANCSLPKQISDRVDGATVLSFLIAICAIVIATFSTGIDSKAFQFCRDCVRSEDDIPYKYSFFHFIFSIGSMYFAMLFTNWELNHPTRKWRIDVGWASTWVKILNEWFAVSIYLWTLIYPAIRRENAINPDESLERVDTSV